MVRYVPVAVCRVVVVVLVVALVAASLAFYSAAARRASYGDAAYAVRIRIVRIVRVAPDARVLVVDHMYVEVAALGVAVLVGYRPDYMRRAYREMVAVKRRYVVARLAARMALYFLI